MPYRVLHRPEGSVRERLLLVGNFQRDFHEALRQTDLLVEEVTSGKEALHTAAKQSYGVVVCSLKCRDAWGLDILDAIERSDAFAPVIISTHEQNPRVVVQAMKHGAFDYIIEPFQDVSAVLAIIERAIRHRAAVREAHGIRETISSGNALLFETIASVSTAMKNVCHQIRQAAPLSSPILIEGESGTGKELIAREIHNVSRCRSGPFIAVNCGAITEQLLESELFGHEKGAFTGAGARRRGYFEEAHGGTLFLDEVALMSPACQGKLLRVLENGMVRRVGSTREFPVNARVVAATNEPLDALAAAGRFRQDLFYRLNVFNLHLPALRERRDDISLLAYYFADKLSRDASKQFKAFSPEALEVLSAHDFPGNVRELRNIIHRAVVFSRGGVIGVQDLPENLRQHSILGILGMNDGASPVTGAFNFVSPLAGESQGLNEHLELIERAIIERTLKSNNYNRTITAKVLKINRTTLIDKMRRLGICPKK